MFPYISVDRKILKVIKNRLV